MSAADSLVRLDVGFLDTAAQNGVLSLTAGTGVALTGTAQNPVIGTVFAPLGFGTLTIPPGGFGAFTAAIPGLSTDSIFTITLTTGEDDGTQVEWTSVVNNPTPAGPSITVGVQVAAVNAQKYSWVLWKL